jgi:serine/threonine protein phosphatase PrpC
VPLVHDINQRVSDLGVELSPNTGIGTTLTFGVFVPFRLLLAHVGDSRCYRIRRGRIEPLTEDHSVENEARHRRARGQSAEYSERFRHALTRCIGQPTEPEVDVSEQALEAGDLYLFASDGVTRVLTEPEVAETLSAKGSLKDRLDNLIRRVLERGAPDNATAVVVEVVEPN